MKQLMPNYMTDDMQATIDFYTNKLGFEVANHLPEEKPYQWASLSRGDIRIMFQTRESLVEDLQIWHDHKIGTTMNLYIVMDTVEEVEQLNASLEETADYVHELRDTYYGMKDFSIRDVNGYVLTIGAPREQQSQ